MPSVSTEQAVDFFIKMMKDENEKWHGGRKMKVTKNHTALVVGNLKSETSQTASRAQYIEMMQDRIDYLESMVEEMKNVLSGIAKMAENSKECLAYCTITVKRTELFDIERTVMLAGEALTQGDNGEID